jgi:hypothetical protein
MSCLDDLDIVARAVRDEWEEAGETIEVSIKTAEKDRSSSQNRLAFAWYKHLAAEMQDGTPEDKRAYCKLCIGVPIRREKEEFRVVYDEHIRPLSYEAKIACMKSPIDFPVTRDMTIKEMTTYLNNIDQHFAEQGVILPRPDDLYYAAMGIKR